jgi:hypothetical protein
LDISKEGRRTRHAEGRPLLSSHVSRAVRLDYPRRSVRSGRPYPVPKGHVPKRNYGFEKRQKELAKLQKREQKAQRRAERAASPGEPELEVQPTDPTIPPEE